MILSQITPGQILPFANHLWQSTIFAAMAGLLTLFLRKNRAQVRYGLWLVASVKFLIPFSLLVTVGSLVGRHSAVAIAPSELAPASDLSFVIERASDPFGAPLIPPAPPLEMPAVQRSYTGAILAVLITVWAIGFLTMVCRWTLGWRRMRALTRNARTLDLPIGLPVKTSPACGEPGVYGIVRPVLLLPAWILDCLTAPELEAIVAHELCHVRRRDNLASTIHMAVQAVFWFHPLVWLLGARLLEERELACDEEVLRMGGEPRIYADGILKICELYLASPLACVAGVTGGDLKRRIEAILSNRAALRMSYAKKAALTVAGLAALAAPVTVGVIHAPTIWAQSLQAAADKMEFEVVSVKPNKSGSSNKGSNIPLGPGSLFPSVGGRLSIVNHPVMTLIAFAYKITGDQEQALRLQVPGWVLSDSFDIEARAAGTPTKDEMRLMVRSLLADRFKLVIRAETREVPIFALVLLKPEQPGPRLRRHPPESSCVPGVEAVMQVNDSGFPVTCGGLVPMPHAGGRLSKFGARNVTMTFIANQLSIMGLLGRHVQDQTRLTGNYDFTLEWSPELTGAQATDAALQEVPPGPTFQQALAQQLGAKLVSQKGLADILIVDHVEHPSEN
jgi:uncharacterized protein (TIGR03435 family)